MPSGFKLATNSVATPETNLLNYVIAYDTGKRLFVTEQPRPPFMEEVQKKVQFTTYIGKAYIATLGGRTAGFIVTDKTLIIVSAPDKIDDARLRQLMTKMASI
jgi:hypothetical protein